MSHVHFTHPQVLADLRAEYERRRGKDRDKLHEFQIEQKEIRAEEMRWAKRHLLLVEKQEVIDAFHQGVLSQTVYEKLLADIDARLLDLESGENDAIQDADSAAAARDADP